jgi:hypothetical protein
MNCFKHQDVVSVGMCKSCHKGVCSKCAIDVGNGIACIDSCENEVRSVNEMIAKGKTAYAKSATISRNSGRFILTLGIPFLAIGIYDSNMILIPIGIVFTVYGIISIKNAKKFDSVD